MKNKVVHYTHFNKLWYYWLDEYENKKYWRKLKEDNNDIHLLSEEIITERQCREELQEVFPDHRIMKSVPFHYSPSNQGSRPIKHTVDRKRKLKEKFQFKKELESFVGVKEK